MTIDYEVEYNNRARVPEHPEIFARWQREAAAYRAAAYNAKLGIPYGPSARRTIDLFPAKDDDKAPLAMFIHGGWSHLLGNLWFLWLFGDNIEDQLGHLRFLAFYLLTGCAAAALQVGLDSQSMIPMIGASGAIAGVLGAYALAFPVRASSVFCCCSS